MGHETMEWLLRMTRSTTCNSLESWGLQLTRRIIKCARHEKICVDTARDETFCLQDVMRSSVCGFAEFRAFDRIILESSSMTRRRQDRWRSNYVNMRWDPVSSDTAERTRDSMRLKEWTRDSMKLKFIEERESDGGWCFRRSNSRHSMIVSYTTITGIVLSFVLILSE